MVFKSCSNSVKSDGTVIEVESFSDNGLPVFGLIEFFFLFQTKELNSIIFSVYFSNSLKKSFVLGNLCLWILSEEYRVFHNLSVINGHIGETNNKIVEKHLCKVYSDDIREFLFSLSYTLPLIIST